MNKCTALVAAFDGDTSATNTLYVRANDCCYATMWQFAFSRIQYSYLLGVLVAHRVVTHTPTNARGSMRIINNICSSKLFPSRTQFNPIGSVTFDSILSIYSIWIFVLITHMHTARAVRGIYGDGIRMYSKQQLWSIFRQNSPCKAKWVQASWHVPMDIRHQMFANTTSQLIYCEFVGRLLFAWKRMKCRKKTPEFSLLTVFNPLTLYICWLAWAWPEMCFQS